jgi:hypothetical protein
MEEQTDVFWVFGLSGTLRTCALFVDPGKEFSLIVLAIPAEKAA